MGECRSYAHRDLQVAVYNLLKQYLGTAPVYATLGNHDTYVI